MCGRFVLMAAGRDLSERFELEEEPSLEPRYNIAPTQMVAAVRVEPHTLRRRLHMLRWGLIPSWAKDASIGPKLINGRAESAAEKPAFRAAFKYRRCLIPADGFYEWKSEKRKKQPYFVQMADGKLFAFAGLWERWKNREGEEVESCTILTTDANELVSPIHDRMPVILSPADYSEWLDAKIKDPKRLKPLLRPRPGHEMKMRPANPKVNSASYDEPECLDDRGLSD